MDTFIVGAGGLGREALDTAIAGELSVRGFVDEALAGKTVRGLKVLAPSVVPHMAGYLVAIADPLARARLADILDERGLEAITLVHPHAVIAPESILGAGCLVMANAYLSSSVIVGRHSQIQYNSTVGHDAIVGDRVTVLPGANVSGSVILENDVTVGSNAVVLQGRTVGQGAFVGAGAVVTRDVPAGAVMVGSPARPLNR